MKHLEKIKYLFAVIGFLPWMVLENSNFDVIWWLRAFLVGPSLILTFLISLPTELYKSDNFFVLGGFINTAIWYFVGVLVFKAFNIKTSRRFIYIVLLAVWFLICTLSIIGQKVFEGLAWN